MNPISYSSIIYFWYYYREGLGSNLGSRLLNSDFRIFFFPHKYHYLLIVVENQVSFCVPELSSPPSTHILLSKTSNQNRSVGACPQPITLPRTSLGATKTNHRCCFLIKTVALGLVPNILLLLGISLGATTLPRINLGATKTNHYCSYDNKS